MCTFFSSSWYCTAGGSTYFCGGFCYFCGPFFENNNGFVILLFVLPYFRLLRYYYFFRQFFFLFFFWLLTISFLKSKRESKGWQKIWGLWNTFSPKYKTHQIQWGTPYSWQVYVFQNPQTLRLSSEQSTLGGWLYFTTTTTSRLYDDTVKTKECHSIVEKL
jgi:hypothetical protein